MSPIVIAYIPSSIKIGQLVQKFEWRHTQETDIRFFHVRVTVHLNKFLYINQLDALISQIYFGMKLYMFRTVPLSIIRSLFTVHSAMAYDTQVRRHLSSRSICSCSKAECAVNKLLMMDRGTVRNM